MAGFSDLTVRIGAEISEFTNGINAAVKEAEKGAREIEKQFRGLSRLGASFADIGKSLTLGLTAPIVGLGGVAVMAAAKLESLEMGLTAVTGSAEETAKQMVRLKEIAKLPGLGLEEAVQGSVALQAVGVESTKAERYIKGFGNALAVVGKGRTELQGVVTQLVQMSAKTKVAADDLKPLMQAVPQLATIVKNNFGTIDTEQLTKMGVSTQQFLDVILKGLEALPQAGGGVGNAIENVKDSFTQAMAEIGKGLKPAVAPALDALDSLINTVKEAAEGFQKLPAPVQAGIGALTATATGPLLFGFGKLLQMGPGLAATIAKVAGTFGTTSLGLLGWSAAIAVVVAALAALATWVYQNWEPIKATLMQAWQGLSELWSAAWTKITSVLTTIWNGYVASISLFWGPVIKFFQTIWTGVAPYFTAVWSSIANFLTGIWTSVSNTATNLWNGIKEKFQAFLTWAKNTIPGAAKLLSLDETWNKEQAKLNKPTASTPTTSPAGKPKVAGIVNTKGVEKLRDLMADVARKAREAFEAWRNPEAAETAKRLVELDAKIADLRKDGVAISEREVEALRSQVREAGLINSLAEKRKEHQRELQKKMDEGITLIQKETEILREQEKVRQEIRQRVEEQSAAVAAQAEAQAQAARFEAEKKVLDDEKTLALTNLDAVNTTTLKEKLNLNAQKLQIELDYLKKSEALELLKNERVKEATLAVLEQMRFLASDEEQAALDARVQRVKQSYEQIANGIKDAYKRTSDITAAESRKTGTQITQDQKKLSGEISTVLTNMNQSIADSIVHWKGFGSTAVSVVQSIGKAIISHLIGSLLLTEDRMKAISDSISGIFTASKVATKTADVTSQAAQISKIGTDAAATASKTASTAIKSVSSTVMGAIGAVGSVVSAVSSVIGNFQMHAMNKSLDIIVKHTLQTANDLANLRADEWLREQHLLAKLDSIWQTIMVKSDMIAQTISGGSAAVAGGGGLTININSPVVKSEADVTAMADAMVRELKLRGIIR